MQPLPDYRDKLRNFRILNEFSSIKTVIPSGIYVVPSTADLSVWYGAIFLRKSLYSTGVFRFLINFPATYPHEKPVIYFRTAIFHPLINYNTGELNLNNRFSNWNAENSFVVLTLAYMKTIFYQSTLYDLLSKVNDSDIYNISAYEMWKSNRSLFEHSAHESAFDSHSNTNLYANTHPSNLLVFSNNSNEIAIQNSLNKILNGKYPN